jgi:hypothetical protein
MHHASRPDTADLDRHTVDVDLAGSQAKAKGFPERIGVTERTVINTGTSRRLGRGPCHPFEKPRVYERRERREKDQAVWALVAMRH